MLTTSLWYSITRVAFQWSAYEVVFLLFYLDENRNLFRFDEKGDGPVRYTVVNLQRVEETNEYRWIKVGNFGKCRKVSLVLRSRGSMSDFTKYMLYTDLNSSTIANAKDFFSWIFFFCRVTCPMRFTTFKAFWFSFVWMLQNKAISVSCRWEKWFNASGNQQSFVEIQAR